MFGGLDQVFGLKINFQVDKIKSANYGFECWKVFWSSFDMKIFEDMLYAPPLDILSGDEDDNTFCICIETMAMKMEDKKIMNDLANGLANNPGFVKISKGEGLQPFTDSFLLSYYNPFIKTIKINYCQIQTENEGIAFDALEALQEINQGDHEINIKLCINKSKLLILNIYL